MFKYFASTNELVLCLRADNMNVVKWWVDASFAVHLDTHMQGRAKKSANDDLFIIDVDSKHLNKESSDFFHSKAAQLLFLGKRRRPDLLTAIFLPFYKGEIINQTR